jgi:hypothetical protein
MDQKNFSAILKEADSDILRLKLEELWETDTIDSKYKEKTYIYKQFKKLVKVILSNEEMFNKKDLEYYLFILNALLGINFDLYKVIHLHTKRIALGETLNKTVNSLNLLNASISRKYNIMKYKILIYYLYYVLFRLPSFIKQHILDFVFNAEEYMGLLDFDLLEITSHENLKVIGITRLDELNIFWSRIQRRKNKLIDRIAKTNTDLQTLTTEINNANKESRYYYTGMQIRNTIEEYYRNIYDLEKKIELKQIYLALTPGLTPSKIKKAEKWLKYNNYNLILCKKIFAKYKWSFDLMNLLFQFLSLYVA